MVKKQHLDIPALYQPHGRYRYEYWGINWRALVALLFAIVPALPGLVYNVNPNENIGGAIYISNFNWYYTFVVSFIVHVGLSLIWPAKESLVPYMIESVENAIEGQPEVEKEATVISAEKH